MKHVSDESNHPFAKLDGTPAPARAERQVNTGNAGDKLPVAFPRLEKVIRRQRAQVMMSLIALLAIVAAAIASTASVAV